MGQMVPRGSSPGGLIPTTPIMPSQTYASPMSFVGSARRIGAWAGRHDGVPAFAFVAWATALIAIAVTWAFLIFWYLFVFGLFGVFTIPYRLVRRSQRKSLAVQKQQLATMQAMMVQQQRVLSESAVAAPSPATVGSTAPPAVVDAMPSLRPPRTAIEEAQDPRNWT